MCAAILHSSGSEPVKWHRRNSFQICGIQFSKHPNFQVRCCTCFMLICLLIDYCLFVCLFICGIWFWRKNPEPCIAECASHFRKDQNTLLPINPEIKWNRKNSWPRTHAACIASHTCFYFCFGTCFNSYTILMRDKPAKIHPNSQINGNAGNFFGNILSVFVRLMLLCV